MIQSGDTLSHHLMGGQVINLDGPVFAFLMRSFIWWNAPRLRRRGNLLISELAGRGEVLDRDVWTDLGLRCRAAKTGQVRHQNKEPKEAVLQMPDIGGAWVAAMNRVNIGVHDCILEQE